MVAAKIGADEIVAIKELAVARLREYAAHRVNNVTRGGATRYTNIVNRER